MKKLNCLNWRLGCILGLAILLTDTGIHAMVPDYMPVGGVLTDNSGMPLNGDFKIVFNIYDSATADVPLWTQTNDGDDRVVVKDGAFSTYLGAINDDLTFMDFLGETELWLGITVEDDNEMNRILFGTVPFAFEARYCEQIGEMTEADIQPVLTDACPEGTVFQGWDANNNNAICVPAFPTGGIIMWSGAISAIPTGWALCDGSNGTPDLTDRFIMGVGTAEEPGATGGANNYALTESQLPAHAHAGNTGAGTAHSHAATTVTAGSHKHALQMNVAIDAVTGGSGDYLYRYVEQSTNGNVIQSAGSHTHTVNVEDESAHTHAFTTGTTGDGAAIDNRPAYFKLAFIIKL